MTEERHSLPWLRKYFTLTFVLSHRGRGVHAALSQKGARDLSLPGVWGCPTWNSLESLFGKEGLRELR